MEPQAPNCVQQEGGALLQGRPLWKLVVRIYAHLDCGETCQDLLLGQRPVRTLVQKEQVPPRAQGLAHKIWHVVPIDWTVKWMMTVNTQDVSVSGVKAGAETLSHFARSAQMVCAMHTTPTM